MSKNNKKKAEVVEVSDEVKTEESVPVADSDGVVYEPCPAPREESGLITELNGVKYNLGMIAPGNREIDLAVISAIKHIDQAIKDVKFIEKALLEKK